MADKNKTKQELDSAFVIASQQNKLSYRIKLRDILKQKAFIDELRTLNGNLEISLVPYTENNSAL